MFQLFKERWKLILLHVLIEQKVIITAMIPVVSSFDILKCRHMLRLGLEMFMVKCQVFDMFEVKVGI